MNLEQINLGYSLKNIPIPSSKQYMKCLIEKVDSFIRRIRWKTVYHIKYIPVPIVTSLLLSYQPPQLLVTQMSLLFAGEPADYSLV